MDAYDDVEMVATRNYQDEDEVYPVEDLYEDELMDKEDEAEFGGYSYKPRARRQNRCFAFALICSVALLLVGVVMYTIIPRHNAEIEVVDGATASKAATDQQGGGIVSDGTNAQQHAAKVKENRDKNSTGINHDKKGHVEQALTPAGGGGDVTWKDQNGVDPDAANEGTAVTDAPTQTPTSIAPTQNPHSNQDDADYTEWHQAKVTLEDGVQYEVLSVLEHDVRSFTEGLTYFNGKLWESVGLQKQSQVLLLDPKTGKTIERIDMDSKYFGEGLTYYNGKLIQLTYKAQTGFVYDANDLTKKPESFHYKTTTGEGWGLTYDPTKNELIVSDGSAYLHFWDPDTFQQIRKRQIIRLDGRPAEQINELEFWRGRVVANVWFKHVLLIINPTTGFVEKEYDFSTIWEQAGLTRNEHAEVFNGIAVSEDPDILYVTGKWWSNMFKIKLLPAVDII